MPNTTQIIIIDKTGTIKSSKVPIDFEETELYKKCRFKKPDNFEKRHTWKLRMEGESLRVSLYARDHGVANTENKYDLPPPVDTTLYFGSIALVARTKDGALVSMDEAMWLKIYEALFGGFENLADTAAADAEESDELEDLPDEMKTAHGYLKDNFVVDDNHSSSGGSVSQDNVSPEAELTTEEEEEETDPEYESDLNESELDLEDYETESEVEVEEFVN